MFEFIEQELEDLKKNNLFREFKKIEKISGTKITIDGKEYINFCSNDYLGLSQNPQIKEKAAEAIREYGFGAGASRLISGTSALHIELEEKIARYKNCQAAIVFSTGYQANLGTITSLVGKEDTVICDRLNHASIIDACRLSGAKFQIYRHCGLKDLEKILRNSLKFKKKLVITEAVFSMDGDIAPIKEITEISKKYGALTMVDYAHATGVIEQEGQPDIIMGTLSKALGSIGGFVAGNYQLIDYLRNKARSFIYTTALPPSACAAALAALEIIQNSPKIIEKLWENIYFFHQETSTLISKPQSAIIPILIGDTRKTLECSAKLFEQGFFISAIRPPTVPKGTSRLRITINASHTKEELKCLASSLRELIPVSEKPM